MVADTHIAITKQRLRRVVGEGDVAGRIREKQGGWQGMQRRLPPVGAGG